MKSNRSFWTTTPVKWQGSYHGWVTNPKALTVAQELNSINVGDEIIIHRAELMSIPASYNFALSQVTKRDREFYVVRTTDGHRWGINRNCIRAWRPKR